MEMKNAQLKKQEPERTSRAERLELAKLVRARMRVVRHAISHQEARQLAELDRQLAAEYSAAHERWTKITQDARQRVAQADAEIAKRCCEMGVPESFRPRLTLGWWDRGENADQTRRAELRKVAHTELAARARAAKVEVDRVEADLLTQIAGYGLRSLEARNFLESMPTIDQLMPKLKFSDLEKRVPLPRTEEP